MSLSRSDLDRIRAIVRDEIASALARQDEVPPLQPQDSEPSELSQHVSAVLAEFRRKCAERAARPVPAGPFLDRYDAARLAGVSIDTISKWTHEGRLTKHKVKGRIQVARDELDAIVAVRRGRR